MTKHEDDIIAGSITYEGYEGRNHVLDFTISDEPSKKGNLDFKVNYRGRGVTHINSIHGVGDSLSNPDDLIEEIKKELKMFNLKYIDTKLVPRKFKFENQKTTDMILSGKNLSEQQIKDHFYENNGEYSNDKEYLTLGYRKFAPAGWAFFGGMVEPHQDAWENMTEELKEEAQLKLEDLTTTELGEFQKREVRGTIVTTVYSQTSKDLSTVKPGDDIEDVLFIDKQGLSHFLINNAKLIVPHHLELLKELADQAKLPDFINEAVIGKPKTLQSLLDMTAPSSINALLINAGKSVSILLDASTTISSFNGTSSETATITFPASEFKEIFMNLPEPLSEEQNKMIQARRVSGGAGEIYTGAHQQFKTPMPKNNNTISSAAKIQQAEEEAKKAIEDIRNKSSEKLDYVTDNPSEVIQLEFSYKLDNNETIVETYVLKKVDNVLDVETLREKHPSAGGINDWHPEVNRLIRTSLNNSAINITTYHANGKIDASITAADLASPNAIQRSNPDPTKTHKDVASSNSVSPITPQPPPGL